MKHALYSCKRFMALGLAVALTVNMLMFGLAAGADDSAGGGKFDADFSVELNEDKTSAEISLAVTPAADNITITGIELPDGSKEDGGDADYHATENGDYTFIVYYDETQEIVPPAPPADVTAVDPITQPEQTELPERPVEDEPAIEETPGSPDEPTVPEDPEHQLENSEHGEETPVGVPPQESEGPSDSIFSDDPADKGGADTTPPQNTETPEATTEVPSTSTMPESTSESSSDEGERSSTMQEIADALVPAAAAAELDEPEAQPVSTTVSRSETVTYELTQLAENVDTHTVTFYSTSGLVTLDYTTAGVVDGQPIGINNIPSMQFGKDAYFYGYCVGAGTAAEQWYYSAEELANMTITKDVTVRVVGYVDSLGEGTYDPEGGVYCQFSFRTGDEGTFYYGQPELGWESNAGNLVFSEWQARIMQVKNLPEHWKLDGYYVNGKRYSYEDLVGFGAIVSADFVVYTFPDFNDNDIDDRIERVRVTFNIPSGTGEEGTVSTLSIFVRAGETIPINAVNVEPTISGTYLEGWYENGILVDNIYEIPIWDERTFEVRYTNKAPNANIKYYLRNCDQGSLLFQSATAEVDRPIGMEYVPTVDLPEHWKLTGYYIDGKLYTAHELAQYIPQKDITIEIATFPDLNDDVIDDRTQLFALSFTIQDGAQSFGVLSAETATAYYGQTLDEVLPIAKPKSNYKFDGWYTQDGTAISDPSQHAITRDIQYTAKFSPIIVTAGEHTVTFYSTSSLVTLDYTTVGVVDGQPIGINNIPSMQFGKDAYFYGYCVGAGTAAEQWYYSAEELANMTITKDVTVRVVGYVDSFGEGTYDPQGGVYCQFSFRTGDEGTFYYGQPELGWENKAGNLVFSEWQTRIMQVSNLPEHWKLDGYYVNDQRFTLKELNGLGVLADADFIVHTFPDFNDNNIDDRIELYTVKLVVNPDDGAAVNSSINLQVRYNENIPAGGADIITAGGGYHFDGWYKDGVLVDDIYSEVITKDTTYVAKFSKDTFTISFTPVPAEGGSVSTAAAAVGYGKKIPATVTASANVGYQFDGWYNEAGQKIDLSAQVVTSNQTYEARFSKPVPVMHTVTYKMADGQEAYGSIDKTSATVTHNTAIGDQAATAIPKTDCRFDGWYRDGVKVNDLSSEVITGDITYEARFSKLPPAVIKHTVTFIIRAGDEGYGSLSTATLTVQDGKKISAGSVAATPAGSKDSFVGWYKDGVMVADLFNEVVSADVTYEAWFSHRSGGGGGGGGKDPQPPVTPPTEPEKPPVTPTPTDPVTPPIAPEKPPVIPTPITPVDPGTPSTDPEPSEEVILQPDIPGVITPAAPAPVLPITPPPTDKTPAPGNPVPDTPRPEVEITPDGEGNPNVVITPENENGNIQQPEFGQSGEHKCCILHFLILLIALAVELWFTHNRKKHQKEEFDMQTAIEANQDKEGK